jgi:hypothetical protein
MSGCRREGAFVGFRCAKSLDIVKMESGAKDQPPAK